MLKKVGIQVAGSGGEVKDGYVVTEETTAQELLTRANLGGYQLCPSDHQLPLGKTERVYEKVGDGSVLYAYREATAGANAPAFSYPNLIQRRGWVQEDKWCYGYYRTKYGSFEGKVRFKLLGPPKYYLRYPPDELKRHRHWGCFARHDNGWYSVHFSLPPRSLDDGIKNMEELIVSAFNLAQKNGGK
jgi:hypothetical protein